jgi:hypothetical protein|tara:strand:+ start:388 stop:1047 length:660 start_codon:yes stop_codon:yes gene_type:complete
MKLITEVIEEVQVVTEAKENGDKSYFIEGIFMQGNQKNRNGRIYPVDVLEREVDRYNKEYIQKNRAYGELGHPQGPTINLDRVSHMIKELYRDGDNFKGKAKIMDTPMGNIVKNLMNEDATLGVSSRGMGSLKAKNGANEVQKDFYLATAGDIVADPSAPNAFVEGIMEGKEWVWDNGIIKEVDIVNYRDEINESIRKRQKEEATMQVFEDFLQKLRKL